MIKSFHCKQTRQLFEGKVPKKFQSLGRQAIRKLQMLDDAVEINDLRSPPGNRLESLKGDRDGRWSIRINQQWRLCFTWKEGEGGPSDVEIVDYH